MHQLFDPIFVAIVWSLQNCTKKLKPKYSKTVCLLINDIRLLYVYILYAGCSLGSVATVNCAWVLILSDKPGQENIRTYEREIYSKLLHRKFHSVVL